MGEALVVEFDTSTSNHSLQSEGKSDPMVAPERRDPMPPNVERRDDLVDLDDDMFDVTRPIAFEADFSAVSTPV